MACDHSREFSKTSLSWTTYIITQPSSLRHPHPSPNPHPPSFPQIIKAVAHLMKLELNANSQRSSCSFLSHASGQHSGFVTCHRGGRGGCRGRRAWTPHRWIVINYHQAELSGWCTTGSGSFPHLQQTPGGFSARRRGGRWGGRATADVAIAARLPAIARVASHDLRRCRWGQRAFQDLFHVNIVMGFRRTSVFYRFFFFPANFPLVSQFVLFAACFLLLPLLAAVSFQRWSFTQSLLRPFTASCWVAGMLYTLNCEPACVCMFILILRTLVVAGRGQ